MKKNLLLICLLGLVSGVTQAADSFNALFKTHGKFADVRDMLVSTIEGRGLKINHANYIADMLERTGKDLGATKQVYVNGEQFEFCSATISRAMAVVVRTTEDMLTLVPDTLREAAASIGLPRALMITKVAYRAARAGMITGVLLAVARISGETAPLLFTALNNQFWSTNLNAPVASLPVVIFQFALSPYKDWQKLAWTGALIITLAVLALSIIARLLAAQRKSS